MLIIAIGNYSRIIDNGTIRTEEFLSILVIGALTSMFNKEGATTIKEKLVYEKHANPGSIPYWHAACCNRELHYKSQMNEKILRLSS